MKPGAGMTSLKVKLFALSTCSHCKAVKKLLAGHNIDVDVVNVDSLEGDDRDMAIKEVKRHNERVSFPTTVIGGEVVVGYKADRIKKALQRQ
jgi:glutaredoxin-like protein NrdH